MSDEKIAVEITDKVSSGISAKIRKIASESRDAQAHVERLKGALADLGKANPLGRLKAQLDAVNGSAAKAAMASQKLATEQARTATAAQRAIEAQQRVATATQRTATEQARTAAASQRLSTEQANTATASQRLATEQARTATAVQKTGTEAQKTAAAAQRLATEEQRTATAAAQAAAAQNRAAIAAMRLQQAQERATRQAGLLSSGLGRLASIAGVSFSVAGVVGMADAYTTLQNKLSTVSESMAQTNKLTEEMFDLAARTRTPVDQTTTAFVRFDRTMKGLGRSQEDTIRLTETVNKALILGGSTTAEASSALIQLSQAFNAGKLQGDEFRSVAENMPIVLDYLAQVTGKPIAELKKMGSEGKITAETMVAAFDLMKTAVDEKFANTVPTLSQAFTVLKDSVTQFFGAINASTGFTASIANAMLFLAANIERVAYYAGTAAVLFGGMYVAGIVSAAIATGGLSGALAILRTALIRTGIGALVVLVGELIYQFVKLSGEVGGVSNLFSILGATGKAALDWIIAGGYAMIDAFNGITLSIAAAFTSLWAQVQAGFASLMAALQAGINKMITSLNEAFTFSVSNPFTGEVIASMNGLGIATTNFAEGYIKAAESSAAASVDLSKRAGEAFDSMGDRFSDLKNPLDVYSEGMSKARSETEAANAAAGELEGTLRGSGPNTTGAGAGGGGGGGGKKGGGGGGGGAVNALQEMNSEMEKELELLKLLPKEREIEKELQEKVNALKEKGIILSQAETAALRDKIAALKEANAVAEQEAQFMNNTVYAREQYIQQLQALKNLRANPESGFTAGDAAGQAAGLLDAMGIDTSTMQVALDGQLAQIQTYYDQIKAMRDADMISERDYSNARIQLAQKERELKLATFRGFFDNLATLQSSNVESLARIGKAAAITQAVINTYEGATKALAQGGIYGAVMAASVVATGMAQIAQIRAQSTSTGAGYMTGGYTGDLGRSEIAGVVHGREYVMDAGATSRIGTADLDALRTGAAYVQRADESAPAARSSGAGGASGGAGNGSGAVVNLRIVNVLGDAAVEDYMKSERGETLVLNAIEANPEVVKRIVADA